MKKGSFFVLGIFCVFLFLMIMAISAVSAEIMLNQPGEVYNLDDEIFVSAALKSPADSSGLFRMSLLCNANEKDFYISPAKLSASVEKKFETYLPLSNSFLEGDRGRCRVTARYLSESAETIGFELTDRIDATLKMNKSILEPGEGILIEGEAIKANKKAAEGYAQLSVIGTNISAGKAVERGKFTINFSMPENSKAGAYVVAINVYEKDSQGELSNQGTATASITIKQILTSIEIVMEKQDYMPGENLSIKPVLYDQAGEIIDSEASLSIIDTDGKGVFEQLVKSGEEILFPLAKNSTPGGWKAIAKAYGREKEKVFFIKENEEALFDIQGNLLKVTNTGNIPYKKNIEIRIGNQTEIIQPEINVGESTIYELEAPDGEYEIIVNDGTNSIQKTSYLTGNVIGVNELAAIKDIFSKHPMVWAFLVLIMGMFIFITGRRMIKERVTIATEPVLKEKGFMKVKPKTDEGVRKISIGQGQRAVLKKPVREAEPGLVQHGTREDACIAVVKINNYEQIKRIAEANKVIAGIADIANEKKAAVYKSPEHILLVLSPMLTRTFKNDASMVKIASRISSALNEYNRKARDKIEYGIGINSGAIISRIENGILKFTSLGNALALAKKIADAARNDVLLSRITSHNAMAEVKTEKKNIQGLDVYSINRIVEREENKEFIQKFMQRQKDREGLDERLQREPF